MKIRTKLLALALVAAFFVTCVLYAQEHSEQTTHGIVVADIDKSVQPGDNFFEYTNFASTKFRLETRNRRLYCLLTYVLAT